MQTALKGIPTQPLNSARACKYRMLVNVRLVGTFSNFLFYGRCDYCKEPFEISLEVRSCGQWNLWFLGLKKPVAVGEIYLVLSTQGAKKAKTPRGGTRSIHDGGGGGGGGDVFFWVENLHTRYFFGSSDLSRISLGLNSERTFRFGFPLRSADQKNIHSNFFSATCVPKKLLILRRQYNVHLQSCFWVGNFNARYFFGSKISGLCIFLGLQYEAPSDPPVMYTSSTPLGQNFIIIT